LLKMNWYRNKTNFVKLQTAIQKKGGGGGLFTLFLCEQNHRVISLQLQTNVTAEEGGPESKESIDGRWGGDRSERTRDKFGLCRICTSQRHRDRRPSTPAFQDCWAAGTNKVKKCTVRKIIRCTGLTRAAKAGQKSTVRVR
jgi:hypothetical protein